MTGPDETQHAPPSAAQEGGWASAPPPAQCDDNAAHGAPGSDWWNGIMQAAVRWRLDEEPDRRLARALAALLSLTTETREALIEHLVTTWGRDVLLRRLSLGWKERGDDDK
jgi:hypothetical protein